MAIAYIDDLQQNITSNGTGNATASLPTHQAGDVLVAVVSFSNYDDGSSEISATGWTRAGAKASREYETQNYSNLAVLWRVAANSSTTLNLAVTDQVSGWQVITAVFRGSDATAVYGVSVQDGIWSGTSTPYLYAPSVAATKSPAIAYTVIQTQDGFGSANKYITAPTGMTQIAGYQDWGMSGWWMGAFYQARSDLTATGQREARQYNGGSSGIFLSVSLIVGTPNSKPVATVTSPAAATKFDPRLPLQIGWSYSDANSQGQSQSQVSWRVAGGTWNDRTAVAGAGTTYTFPANTITDVSDVEVRVRAHDGVEWGDWSAARSLRSDSWTYEPEIIGTGTTDSIDTSTWVEGEYQVQVATADAIGYGPYGQDTTIAVDTKVAVFNGTAFVSAPRNVRVGSSWVKHNPELQ